jgi:hypothetical protein
MIKKKGILCILCLLVAVYCHEGNSPKLKTILGLANNLPSVANNSYSVGGTVSGLSGGSLSIALNSEETLTLAADGNFTFLTLLNSSATYTVTISSYPSGKYCSIQNETGTISANVSNITIACQEGTANGPLVGGSILNPLTLTYQVTTLGSAGSFLGVNGITTDGTNIYTANAGDHTVNKFVPSTSAYTLLAGQVGSSGNIDAIGNSARFNNPMGLVYVSGYLYVTDNSNSSVRKIDLANNSVSTVATGLTSPYGITSDGSYLYVTVQHQVKKISLSTFSVTSLAGNSSGYADGTGTSANFNITATTGSITFDGTDLFLVDNGNCAIRKITTSSGVVTTVVGSPPPAVVCSSVDGVGTTTARLGSVDGIASDGTNLYMAETSGSCLIKKITMSSLTLTTVVGSSGSCSLLDGTGTAARVNNPAMMTSDGVRLYLADWGNDALRKIE